MAITTPYKRRMHLELPPYMLELPPPTDGQFGTDPDHDIGMGISTGSFPPRSWKGFTLKSADAPVMPVLWSEDFWKYYVLWDRDGEVISDPSGGTWTIESHRFPWQPAPIKWGTKGSMLSLPRVILCSSDLVPIVAAAGVSLGDAFVKKNVLIASDPGLGTITSGLPWHGIQYPGGSPAPIVHPEQFIAGEVLALSDVAVMNNYFVMTGGPACTMGPNAPVDADTVKACAGRFVKWEAHLWFSNGTATFYAVQVPVAEEIMSLVDGMGWQLYPMGPMDYSATVADVTPIIASFFGL